MFLNICVISYFHRARGVVTSNQTFIVPYIFRAHGAVNLVYSTYCAHGVVISDLTFFHVLYSLCSWSCDL